jgi:hypothetical protein
MSQSEIVDKYTHGIKNDFDKRVNVPGIYQWVNKMLVLSL